ncbi:hypothetical protein IUSA1_10730 [Streptococcus iniae IUSA1]|nr:hypothetical protein IUSA1_10730 [Streptococcus iniae IUSA1]
MASNQHVVPNSNGGWDSKKVRVIVKLPSILVLKLKRLK